MSVSPGLGHPSGSLNSPQAKPLVSSDHLQDGQDQYHLQTSM